MPRYGPEQATIAVRVHREGLLVAAGHDLVLHATRFAIEEDAAAVRASVDASSLVVVASLHGEREDADRPPDVDRRTIERTVREEILRAGRHPAIELEGTHEGGVLDGRLRLRGVERPVRAEVRSGAGGRTVELAIDQRAFGIEPYRALLGALRVKAVVAVRVRLPR